MVECADVKGELFARLERLAPEAILATNTSSLSVTALAAGLARPERFAGLHFFNPAPIMKLVEVVAGARTDPAIAARLLDAARAWGKHAVLARDVPGFIVNRLARPFYGEGWRALEEGVGAPEAIDWALKAAGGFRMGPLELGDLIGHDVNSAVARSIFEAYFGRTRFTPSLAQGQLVASGRFGRKTGGGVYGPEGPAAPAFLAEGPGGEAALVVEGDGRSAAAVAAERGQPVCVLDWARPESDIVVFMASDEAAAAAGARHAAARGKKALRLADRPGGLVLRTWAQLANAAADALRDRVASRADLDAALVFGVNYPIGPLAWAEALGAAKLVAVLDAIARETGEAMYAPGEVLRRWAVTKGEPDA